MRDYEIRFRILHNVVLNMRDYEILFQIFWSQKKLKKYIILVLVL